MTRPQRVTAIHHEFRRTTSPTFGSAFGGACDVEIDRVVCGYPETDPIHKCQMIVYLALGDCGDYYCDGEHPLGVFSTEELARARHVAYQKDVQWQFQDAGGVGPLTIDENNPDYLQGIEHG